MRYWDASALVPLIIREPSTPQVSGWHDQDPRIVTWVWSRVEVASAIERRARHGALSGAYRLQALRQFEALAAGWAEVGKHREVRGLAMDLLGRHPLRAADAGQLAAAMMVRQDLSGSIGFVSLDRRLAEAARREGFLVPSESG